jgi:outer membrane protein OmpA-like peptidoglycan-associated protein
MNNFNKLSIKRISGKLHFFINGTDVQQLDASPFFGDDIGFNVKQKMAIEADYLRVSQKRKPLNLIDNYNSYGDKIHLDQNVNTPYIEKMPVISADEKTLYIDRAGDPSNTGNSENDDVWVSTLNSDSTWSKMKNIGPPINNKSYNFVFSVSSDNNTVLLGNVYLDGGGMTSGCSISHRVKNGWSMPKKLNIKNYYNNAGTNEACLAPDNKTILLTASRDDTYGVKDIYVTFLQPDSSWSEPKNIGKTVNTFADETSPFVAADGKTMYFSSAGHTGYGKNDIFMTRRLDDSWTNWSEPKNLGPKINTPGWDAYYTVPASGTYAYLVSTYKDDVNLDVFKIKQPESAKHDPVALIHGFVYNSETKEPVKARISFTELGSTKELGYAIANPNNGAYVLILTKGKKYSIHAVKDGFIPVDNNVDFSVISEYKNQEIDLYLTPMKEGQSIVLNNLFFKANKFDILPESYPELDRLYNLLKDHPTMKIVIEGHTSKNAETDKFNQDLSTNRALAVKTYLQTKGIDEKRINYIGYGFSKPLNTLYDEAHQAKNRRVEFKILHQ